MAVHLSEHFTFKKLFKAVLPPVFMMVFTSIYSIVDGLFVSNFVGQTAFAAVNLMMPILMAFGSLGFMFGVGGCALVAKVLGQGDREKANRIFSMVVYFNIIVGAVVSVLGFAFIEPIAIFLGATPEMLGDCIIYGRIMILGTMTFMLQICFQDFFIVAEKPMLGFLITILTGVGNMILDAVLIAWLHLGIMGAGLATVISEAVGALIPIIYFARKNKSLLRLGRTNFDFKAIWQSVFNGSSELLTHISASVVSIFYNAQLLRFAGENGVAAYGVMMYVAFIFSAIFIGYCIGVSPIVSYQYGAKNQAELKNLYRKSLLIIALTGIVMTTLTQILANPLCQVFVGYNHELYEMTLTGIRLFALCFLINGFNIFASAFFTALNNGLVSAIISFARTLLFQIICVMVLPLWFGIIGIWVSIIVSEILAVSVSLLCLLVNKKKYCY